MPDFLLLHSSVFFTFLTSQNMVWLRYKYHATQNVSWLLILFHYSPGGQRLKLLLGRNLVFRYHWCIFLDLRKYMLHLPGETSIELWFLTKKTSYLPFVFCCCCCFLFCKQSIDFFPLIIHRFPSFSCFSGFPPRLDQVSSRFNFIYFFICQDHWAVCV